MKYYFAFFILSVFIVSEMSAQNENLKQAGVNPEPPYAQIPQYPDEYTSGNVAARMIDGLGFRYYWATEGLREEDLKFKPSEMARTSGETLDHIYGLSKVIVNAADRKPNGGGKDEPTLTFKQKREKTLQNFKRSSDLLKAVKGNDLGENKVIFQRGENSTEYPFWNLLNGPVADAIWHVGQVVSFRRSSGNPLNPKVSVFNGRLRE